MTEQAGLCVIGTTIREVIDGRSPTVNELAEICAVARSTAFDVISKMEDAKLIMRDVRGRVYAASLLRSLIFARAGLAGLSGPAEAALSWLHDCTGCPVRLVSLREPDHHVVMSVGFRAQSKNDVRLMAREVAWANGEPRARLIVEVSRWGSATLLTDIGKCLEEAGGALQ